MGNAEDLFVSGQSTNDAVGIGGDMLRRILLSFSFLGDLLFVLGCVVELLCVSLLKRSVLRPGAGGSGSHGNVHLGTTQTNVVFIGSSSSPSTVLQSASTHVSGTLTVDRDAMVCMIISSLRYFFRILFRVVSPAFENVCGDRVLRSYLLLAAFVECDDQWGRDRVWISARCCQCSHCGDDQLF